MADDVYSCASGGTIRAGIEYLPAWHYAQADNTWDTVPITNTLASLNPKNNPALNPNFPNNPEWFGSGGEFSRIISAWCGAVLNLDNDDFWIPLPAGHADYCGAEPYKVNLGASSPSWQMMHPPAGALPNTFITNDGQEATGLYQNGRPRAIHSYNKILWIPEYGIGAVPQGSTSHSGQSGTSKPIIIDSVTGEMTRFGATIPVGSQGNFSGGCAVYDSLRKSVWVRSVGTARWHRYALETDEWVTNLSPSYAGAGYNAGEYIAEHDCILWLNANLPNGKLAILDCATGAVTHPTVTGSLVGMTSVGSCTPRNFATGKFAVWDNATNTTAINVLSFTGDPRTADWQITQLPVAPSNSVTPSARTANGTYGRFAYSKRMNRFFVINDVSQPMYTFKLGAN